LQFGGDSPLTMRARVVYGRYAIGHCSVRYRAGNWNLSFLRNDGILRMPGKTDCHTSLMAGSQ
ncbi:MAG: hypothetical protein PUD80_03920, partial [Firmicutes bacterium]|nr:hypothetical protein [Bacillota bacterium]